MIKWIDRLGNRIASWLTPLHQRRIGVLMMMMSLPLIMAGFLLTKAFSYEFLLYQMSAMALLFGGLATIVSAVPSE